MRRSAAPSRKAVELPESLHRDLTSYALAAGAAGVAALALAPPAAAQIVYTPAHETIGSREKMFIDFNHDGINDVEIREVSCIYSICVQAVPARPGGGIQLGNSYGDAAPLPAGAFIGNGLRFYSRSVDMVELNSSSSRYGSWACAPHAFLGIRFWIQGKTHYGWARIDLQFGLPYVVGVTLTGYAYQTQPNVAIRAGDRGENGENAQGPSGETPSSPDAAAKSAATLGALASGARRIPQRPCAY